MAKKKTQKEPSFEDALKRLEEIVETLEDAELPLEKSLSVFEEGIRLSRVLNQKIGEAERKVEILLRDEEGKLAAAPFDGEAPAEEPGEEGDDGEKDEGGQGGLPF